ncbi:uroporphyrin-3 C-methyltransferase [Sulfuritortus calidifontis]|uniref:Uroporphyrin-3 C-methyltransferase n=1 Tax=Sulfuritortus calidifontis TaxID=1914471 RepID=A0A4R3JY29_9PROT|nr:uroporphyrin-3 C-methyltransferase [Sulfuritortus calidifontis]
MNSPVPDPAKPGRSPWLPLALALAVLALIAAGAVAWLLHVRMQELELQLAKRIGEFDSASRQAQAVARQAGTTLDSVLARLDALEAQSLTAQNQQLALSAMYQELARSQDERVLADIEQTLSLVQEHLQLAGNVRAALIALESAEQRLSRQGKPQFAALRQAIARDVERLRLLPNADVIGLNARLDALIQNIDLLKLESESEPAAKPAKPAKTGAVDTASRFGREMWEEFKQLVRIRRLDHPDLPLLAPEQIYFVKQNLKLRLLSARLAALQGDQATWKSDLTAAQAWVTQYFNRNDPLVRGTLDSLKHLAAASVSVEGADISGSLKALNEARKVVRS